MGRTLATALEAAKSMVIMLMTIEARIVDELNELGELALLAGECGEFAESKGEATRLIYALLLRLEVVGTTENRATDAVSRGKTRTGLPCEHRGACPTL